LSHCKQHHLFIIKISIMGIRRFFQILANIVITSSVALVTTGLTSPIAANETQRLRWWVPVTVGATGGLRAQIVVPAGGILFISSIKLFNTVAPALVTATQAASAAFTNALANAGTHWLEIDATIVNGTTAGNVDLQMAQNTSDALSLTILRGGTLEVIVNNN
jgi:hypothetical protein